MGVGVEEVPRGEGEGEVPFAGDFGDVAGGNTAAECGVEVIV